MKIDPITILRNHTYSITDLLYSTLDGNDILLSSSSDGCISLWDLDIRRVRHSIYSHDKVIGGCLSLNMNNKDTFIRFIVKINNNNS